MNGKMYVHSIRMAGWLMYNGIMYLAIENNKQFSNKKVYVFPNNDRVSRIMSMLPDKQVVQKRTGCL